ncbi:MAG: hypothetical protein EYC70_03845 [Planctomycetota bacterium]|nr:MAG: hypothetical protein EYC70_03845 [Planctomycetota bacterium]
MSDAADKAEKPSKPGRSPNYPRIALERAVELAEILWKHEQKRAAPLQVVLGWWGFEAEKLSGSGSAALSGMRKYGLLESEGNKVRLTPLAHRICDPHPANPDDREKALKEAAMQPKIHQTIRQSWPDSTDEVIEYHLRNDLGFNPGVVAEVVKLYRKAMAYAGLGPGVIMAEDDGKEEEPEKPAGSTHPLPPPPARKPKMQPPAADLSTFGLPLSNCDAVLYIARGITTEDAKDLETWVRMVARKLLAQPSTATDGHSAKEEVAGGQSSNT